MFFQCGKKILSHINNTVIFKFNDCQIYYRIYGSRKKPAVVFLHGWGQDGTTFDGLRLALPSHCAITIDFPPFGKSKGGEGLTIFSYANMVISLCEHLGLGKATFLGHSFGGRVAILVSAMRKDLVKSLVLISSAGMKPKRKISYYLRVFKYKMLKKLKIQQKNAGSADYQNLSEGMKKTFVSVVNVHLEQYCPLIVAPTLIIFGALDSETPVYMAKKLHSLIPNSRLEILDHCGHFCYIERKIRVCELLNSFLEEGK